MESKKIKWNQRKQNEIKENRMESKKIEWNQRKQNRIKGNEIWFDKKTLIYQKWYEFYEQKYLFIH